MLRKRLVSVILAASFAFSSLSVASAVTETNTTAEDASDIVFPTGYVEPENKIEIVKKERPVNGEDDPYQLNGLPESYVNDKLPGLRDQNPYGTCWAFAYIALMEINLMKKGIYDSPDLSELHLAYFAYNKVDDPLGGTEGDCNLSYYGDHSDVLYNGGNYSTAYMITSAWIGGSDENTANYSLDAERAQTVGLQKEIAYDDEAHVEDVYMDAADLEYFRESKDISELDCVKRLIYEQGAAGIQFGAVDSMNAVTSDGIYSEENNCYYNDEPGEVNHAVVIVGWDDTFPKEKFVKTPPGDGAFLVRNSWTSEGSGDEESYAGYFWMSYYEATLSSQFIGVEAESADNFDNNYLYDGYTLFTHSEYSKIANIFEAHADDGMYGEELKAVSFFSPVDYEEYEIKIYTDVKDDPEDGVLQSAATTKGIKTHAGQYTINLNESVVLEPGKRFSVVVSSTEHYLTYDDSLRYYNLQSSSKEGQSYVYDDIDDCWVSLGEKGNCKVRAYTDNIKPQTQVLPTAVSLIIDSENGVHIGEGEFYKVSATVLPEECTNKELVWESYDTSVATVEGGKIRGISVGDTVISVSTVLGDIKKEIPVSVRPKPESITISWCGVNDEYDFFTIGEQFSVIVSPEDYEYQSDVKWYSSKERTASIDQNGFLTDKSPGKTYIIAELNGVFASVEYSVGLRNDAVSYETDDEGVVTFKWNHIEGAWGYRICRGQLTSEPFAEIIDDGSATYEFSDDYFKGSDVKSEHYTFLACMEDEHMYGDDLIVYFGPRYKITYHLYGGIQNPHNADVYIEGVGFGLSDPIPPQDHEFVGWYKDPEFTEEITSISEEESGDLDLYAKYKSIKAAPVVAYIDGKLCEGGNVRFGATLELKTETEGVDIVYVHDEKDLDFSEDLNTPGGMYFVYAGPITLTEDVKIVTYAYSREYRKSDTKTYVFDVDEDEAWGDIVDASIIAAFDNDVSKVPEGIWYVVDEQVLTGQSDLLKCKYSTPYTGEKITLNDKIKVFNNVKKLEENTDYKISYENNLNAAASNAINSPTFYITFTDSANSSSNTGIPFTIEKCDINSASITSAMEISIPAGSKKLSSVKPNLVFNKKQLKTGTDYKLVYYDEEDMSTVPAFTKLSKAGKTYLIKIVAEDSGNFTGEHKDVLRVKVAMPLNKVKIAGLNTTVEYTGKEITLEDLLKSSDKKLESTWKNVTLYTQNSSTKVKTALTRSLDGENGDYFVTFNNDGALGKYTLEFTGINGYTGTIRRKITVKAYNITKDSQSKLKISPKSAAYSKAGSIPEVTVEFKSGAGWDTLKEGIDYKLSFKNNKVSALSLSKPTVVVTGMGNFTGVNSKTTYEIVRQKASAIELTVNDISYKQKGKTGYFIKKPKLTEGGKSVKIGKGRDVERVSEIKYYYENGQEVQKTDIVEPGTTILMKATVVCGEKSYYETGSGDEITGSYKVILADNNLSKYKVSVKNSAVIKEKLTNDEPLESSYFTISNKKKTLSDSDFSISSVKYNIAKESVTVVFKGEGSYGGKKTFSFNIK